MAHAVIWAEVPGVTPPASATATPASAVTVEPSLSDWAGAGKAITLPTVLAFAIRQLPSLASARIDVATAAAQLLASRGVEDWTLAGNANFGISSSNYGGIEVSKQTQFGVTASIGRALPTGGNFSINASTAWINADALGMSNSNWTDTLTATLSQSLLRGRGREIFEANIAKAELSRDAFVLESRQQAISAVQTVVSAYWDLVSAEREVVIRRASLELARERLRVTKTSIDGGKLAPSESLSVEQAIATRQGDVLAAELAVINNSIALRRAAGMDLGPGDVVLTSDEPSIDKDTGGQAYKLDSVLARTMTASPELARLATADRSATIDVEVSKNGLLPQLDAALTLGPSGFSSSAATAFKNMITVDEYVVGAQLTYTQQLGHHAALGQERQARLAREKLRVNAADIRAQLSQAAAQAVAQIEVARHRLEISATAIELCKRNIVAEQSRFELGKSTGFNVLERQDDLRQAQLDQVHAQIDWHKAETVIQSLSGDLLAQFAITVDNGPAGHEGENDPLLPNAAIPPPGAIPAR